MSGGIDAPLCLTIIGRLVNVYSLDAKEMKMGAYPKTLVLYRNKDFYIPKFALESLFYLVKNVTGETNLAQPISKAQLDEIRRQAEAEGVEVKIVESLEQVKECAMLGECCLQTIYY